MVLTVTGTVAVNRAPSRIPVEELNCDSGTRARPVDPFNVVVALLPDAVAVNVAPVAAPDVVETVVVNGTEANAPEAAKNTVTNNAPKGARITSPRKMHFTEQISASPMPRNEQMT